MKLFWRQTALTLFVVATSTISLGSSIQVADIEQLEGLIPNHLIDTSGFQISGPSSVESLSFDDVPTPVPVLPMYKGAGIGRQFVGVVVPAKYLDLVEPKADRRRVIEVNTTSSALSAKARAVAKALSQVKFSDGLGVTTHFYNNNVYAIRSDYRVIYRNGSTVGLSVDFNRGKTVVLGDQFTIGAQLNIGGTISYIHGERGYNAGKTFNEFFENVSTLIDGDSAEQTIDRAVRFAPYLTYYLSQQSKSAFPQVLKAVRNADLNIGETNSPQLVTKVESSRFSKELQQALSKLKRKLSHEIRWKEKIAQNAQDQAIVADVDANRLVQSACDYLSQVYEVPHEIWPRCRIAASWAPNAWAYPGGDIFISAGLLGIISDLDGVMYVLGHEIGHVVGRHTTRRMPGLKAYIYYATALGLAGQAVGAYYGLSAGDGLLGDVNWLTWFPKAMTVSIGGAIPMNYSLKALAFAPTAALMAYGRANEWEADRFGHQASFSAGAHAAGLHKGWEEFAGFVSTYMTNGDQSWYRKVLASHPDKTQRGQKIESRSEEIAARLSAPNQANRLGTDIYQKYQALHELLKPYVIRWGENIRDDNRSGVRRTAQYAIESLISPSGQCIIHALDGE